MIQSIVTSAPGTDHEPESRSTEDRVSAVITSDGHYGIGNTPHEAAANAKKAGARAVQRVRLTTVVGATRKDVSVNGMGSLEYPAASVAVHVYLNRLTAIEEDA